MKQNNKRHESQNGISPRKKDSPSKKGEPSSINRPRRPNNSKRNIKKSTNNDKFLTNASYPNDSSAPTHKASNLQKYSKSRRSSGQRRSERLPLDAVRVIPLGGVEEVGRNMIVVEVGADIFISDIGFEFNSTQENLGIEYFLPNTRYLEKRKHRIKAVFITHAHLDHIGGIPFIMSRLGNPPIYTRPLTSMLIQRRQEDFPEAPPLKINVIELNKPISFGSTKISGFPVTHSIPDSMGVKIETPQGNVLISGDLKLDHNDGVPTIDEVTTFERLGKDKNLIFIADSTNAERTGFSVTEREVQVNIENIIRESKGRVIVGTFASQFSRMIMIIDLAKKLGKKVILEGRSIRNNIDIAQKVGILDIGDQTVIPSQHINQFHPRKVIILATGAQGEEYAALNRMAQRSHKDIRLTKEDTILLSSSVIPGNEVAVQSLKDKLISYGLRILHYRTSDVHSTGHGNAGELVWIAKKIGAKYFMPAYGFKSMTYAHGEALVQSGFSRKNVIFAENGKIFEFKQGQLKVRREKAPSGPLMVDGRNISEGDKNLLEDRQVLAANGAAFISILVSEDDHKLLKSPTVVMVGFVSGHRYALISKEIRDVIRRTLARQPKLGKYKHLDKLKSKLEGKVGRFLERKTSKKPLVAISLISQAH